MNDASDLSALLIGRMKRRGVTVTQAAELMRVSRNTVTKWLKTPETAPLISLLVLCDIIGIRKRELSAAIERI